jgi:hypothetical protein
MTLQTECYVCHSNTVVTFLERKNVPVHQNLVIAERHAALQAERGDLTLGVCEMCGFIFNQSFESQKLSYDAAYDNTQTCSPAFDHYLTDLVRHLIEENKVRNSRIVEVGCGKGVFLRMLIEAEGSGNIGYGFDPTYVGPLSALNGRLRFEKRFYDSTCVDSAADVVVCRHVIEHVPDPCALLATIRQTLDHTQQARVFFETPCVEWILSHQVVWDFFYEHCSYFTAQSLSTAFQRSGFNVVDVQHVFGGQYLWLEASVASETQPISYRPGNIPGLTKQFSAAETVLRQSHASTLQALIAAEPGKIALWGAGAKGVTYANLIDPDCRSIACVVDLNPAKQGHYLAGTGHPIIDYCQLAEYGVSAAILTNPNYYAENLTLLKDAGLDDVRLVNLMDD